VDFDEKILSLRGVLVMVYFWGADCPNCEEFKKHWPEISKRLPEKSLQIFKADAYTHTDLASRFGLHGVPAFILFRDGKTLGRITGFESVDYFTAVINGLL
jgi:thioredoxin 1